MTRWTGIVLALPAGEDEMASRLSTYLHPVAGRPLIWHSVSALVGCEPPPQRVVVVADAELPGELFQDIPGELELWVAPGERGLLDLESQLQFPDTPHTLVLSGAAAAAPEELQQLLTAPEGRWLLGAGGEAVAAWLTGPQAAEFFRLPDPLLPPNGVLGALESAPSQGRVVRSRSDLAFTLRQIRDRVVRQLMDRGVSFLLPESVLVDVDVRVGRDTVIYPGAVLEGQTTIGEETVIGPGCRVISSWIGSGVELKGWNYIAHTSVRNRAILEPYVRRGFD
jgi:hypothetical protein